MSPPPNKIALPFLLSLGILHILNSLPQCLCQDQGIVTRPFIQSQVSSHSTVPKLIETNEPTASTTTEFTTHNIFHSRPQGSKHLSSRRVQIYPRGLLPEISNFATNTIGGFFGNSNSQLNGPTAQSGSAAQNSRQVIYPQDSQPFPSGDSRALMNSQPNAILPHPTQLPSSPIGSPKSQSPLTTSTTSSKAQATAAPSHSHVSPPSGPVSTSSSAAPSATDEPAPRSVFERFRSLYKPTNRFEPLAVLLTVLFVIGFLVTLMAILKCVAHKKRFANKKDYPTGFPWVEPAGTDSNRTSSRQGLVHTKSYTSTRNSITSSVHFSIGRQLGPDGEMTPHQTEYQLNELGSDVYSNYAWAATEMDLEKNLPSPSDEGPSSAVTEDSNHIYTPNQERDQWHTQSLDDGTCFIRPGQAGQGELLEDSKIFKLGHP